MARRSRDLALLANAIAIVLGLWFLLYYRAGTSRLILPQPVSNRYSSSASQTLPAGPSTAIEYAHTFASGGHLIPLKIWQIMLPHPNKPDTASIDPQALQDTSSWLAQNPGYSYVLVGQEAANIFINKHFSNDTKIVAAWTHIQNPGVKSDLLRYLILYIEGGVYTDIDTEALQPIDGWVPPQYRDYAKVVIGIEWDQLDGGSWAEIPHRLQFCQWTIAAAPGHLLFLTMAYHAIDVLERLAAQQQTTLDRMDLSNLEVMTSSGPSAWTDIVLDQIKTIAPHVKDVTDFSGMKPTGPRLYGDILILTIDGFGMGQSHSNSTHDGTIPDAALVKHKFRGSWRKR
jgi:alpha 1,6-mannosyltransferase